MDAREWRGGSGGSGGGWRGMANKWIEDGGDVGKILDRCWNIWPIH